MCRTNNIFENKSRYICDEIDVRTAAALLGNSYMYNNNENNAREFESNCRPTDGFYRLGENRMVIEMNESSHLNEDEESCAHTRRKKNPLIFIDSIDSN